MPVTCTMMDGRHRLIEESTGHIAMTGNGNPVDGGGHESAAECERQAGVINASKAALDTIQRATNQVRMMKLGEGGRNV